jgi:hypothetical protein
MQTFWCLPSSNTGSKRRFSFLFSTASNSSYLDGIRASVTINAGLFCQLRLRRSSRDRAVHICIEDSECSSQTIRATLHYAFNFLAVRRQEQSGVARIAHQTSRKQKVEFQRLTWHVEVVRDEMQRRNDSCIPDNLDGLSDADVLDHAQL